MTHALRSSGLGWRVVSPLGTALDPRAVALRRVLSAPVVARPSVPARPPAPSDWRGVVRALVVALVSVLTCAALWQALHFAPVDARPLRRVTRSLRRRAEAAADAVALSL